MAMHRKYNSVSYFMTDIDECKVKTVSCPEKSKCVSEDFGSYKCVCDSGLVKTDDGKRCEG